MDDPTIAPILARNSDLVEIRKNAKDDKELLKKELEQLDDYDPACYDSVPVDKFGLAMLYGMGYDPNVHKTQPHATKKRIYDRAGLGADKEFKVHPRLEAKQRAMPKGGPPIKMPEVAQQQQQQQ
eukprot:GHVU01225923.1.p2 GENE.GHVU01225923.1~~GHVU01225923.1.p2  ORF type:complete len:125 (+),score=35.57 GHVU01225923.1:444-818(+)